MYRVACLIFLIVAVSASHHKVSLRHWNLFKEQHNKVYSSSEEEGRRLGIFLKNLEKIQEHNALYDAGLTTYWLAVNRFADLTPEEFTKYLGLSSRKPQHISGASDIYRAPLGGKLPDSIDYRKKGAVNPVKDQGNCGSCWAFSTVGALESIYFLKTGKLYSLSEQNLVDCSNSYGNYGCDGGLMESGYKYIEDYGIETEQAYPYKAYDETCEFQKNKSVMSVKGYTHVEVGSESALQAAVANVGPVAVGVDASQWQLYAGGIFSTDGYSYLNHGVVVVGYGAENGTDYWIVRNSWGASWGEAGYIRVARNDNNQVGISDDACYPDL